MAKLNLLFTKDGLQYQIVRNRSVLEEQSFFRNETAAEYILDEKLSEVLAKPFSEINVFSALNHFTLMPEGFKQHDLGYDLIGFNSSIDTENEELMLSINKKFSVQFYYAFPRDVYQKIKAKNIPTRFNFTGEKFLNSINTKGGMEIHINLYHHQCEFIGLNNKKLVIYNNLDVNSEVDFLYFIMFTLSKIGFNINETHFYVYGETSENETFISELGKFVKHLKIIFDNIHQRHFILK